MEAEHASPFLHQQVEYKLEKNKEILQSGIFSSVVNSFFSVSVLTQLLKMAAYDQNDRLLPKIHEQSDSSLFQLEISNSGNHSQGYYEPIALHTCPPTSPFWYPAGDPCPSASSSHRLTQQQGVKNTEPGVRDEAVFTPSSVNCSAKIV